MLEKPPEIKKEILSLEEKFSSERLQFSTIINADPINVAKNADNINIASAVGNAEGTTFPNPYTLEDSHSFISYSKEAWGKGSEYSFQIKNEIDIFIGCIGFKVSEDGSQITNIGYWLGTAHHGNGYASEALAATVNFIKIKFLNVKEMKAGAYIYNVASQKVLEKSGFEKVGVEERENMILRNSESAKGYKYLLKL